MTSTITYNYYKYKYGKRDDTPLNKRIISLARRNNFYTEQIKSLFECGFPIEVIIAKKGKDKVVGFIVFWGNMTERFADRMCMDLKYWLVGKEFRGNNIGRTLYNMMEVQAAEYEIVNYSVMYKKNDEFLEKLYENKGYKFIPIYDGSDTQMYIGGGGSHIKVFKIECNTYQIGSWIKGVEDYTFTV
tara:strand:- start:427 stop:987 length:561 start_codon:yes stop_codon:yes gene_type:complete